MKLSPVQTELLDYINSGGRVHHISGINPYWFRSDTHKIVTSTVWSLEKKGLIQISGKYDLQINLTNNPQSPQEVSPHIL